MISLDGILEELIRSKLPKEFIENKVKEIVGKIIVETGALELAVEATKLNEPITQVSTIEPIIQDSAVCWASEQEVRDILLAEDIKSKPVKSPKVKIKLAQIRQVAKQLNINVRKRLSDQRYRHEGCGAFGLSPQESLEVVVELLLNPIGYKLLQVWAKDNFNVNSKNRIIVELIDPKEGITKGNLKLCRKCVSKTFHKQIFSKKDKKGDKSEWIKCQLTQAIVTPLHFNSYSKDWTVTLRNGNKFVVKKHFKSKEEAQTYVSNFKSGLN